MASAGRSCYTPNMAKDTEKTPDTPAETPRRKGAPTLAPPADPALAAAVEAFIRGDYRAAADGMPADVPDAADDRAWRARLERALGWEPMLWVFAIGCGAAWLWSFIASQPS